MKTAIYDNDFSSFGSIHNIYGKSNNPLHVIQGGKDRRVDASSKRLLLVDDDYVDRMALRRILDSRDHGYQIDEAESTSQALTFCDNENYDCVLLDFRLGDSDALQILPQLKEKSCDGRIAIVLVTGMGNEYLAAQAFKAGIHDYVVKTNLQAEVLFGAVEHAIQTVSLERENERHKAELEFIGFHDHLTGLPNRKLFLDRLGQAIKSSNRTQQAFYVCSMDLDRFKQINDTLGHEAGDKVLREVSDRLVSCLRSSDTVARFGGDEFVALLDIHDAEGSLQVAKKLIDSVSVPIAIEDKHVTVGVSIGISRYPECGNTVKDLLKKADAAMYEAKKSSSAICLYSNEQVPDDKRSVAIATELGSIVSSKSLEVEYQPKIKLSDNSIVGVEALVRWRHPSLGLLPPVEFIPAIERTQIIKPLTYYIADRVIQQCAKWLEQGIEMPVALNLSAKILDSQELPEAIYELLAKWSLPPEYLTLEVTETGALASQQTTANILAEFATLGIKISIDDFGSGYTSFRYLRDFAIHELKIDRMFIDDLVKGKRDESIVKSMLELGSGFGVRVVAEGIENFETLDRLKELGCEVGQGFLFSSSLPADELVLWARQWEVDNN